MRRAGAGLESHRHWRPEWAPRRACLYWYLTFRAGLGDALGGSGLEAVREADWLDAVPESWLHVTLCDVGFTDEVDPPETRRLVDAARTGVAEAGPLHLTFGAAACMEDTIALPVGPLGALRRLEQALRSATERSLGPRRCPTPQHEFSPHLSLGYANRQVSAETAATLLARIGPVTGTVLVDRLVLASVTRDCRYYQWTVLEELPLSGGAGL